MRRTLFAAAFATLAAAVASAQQYPLMNMVADRVVERYQGASCEELWKKRGQPKSDEEKKVVQLMREDPQMRRAFLDKIAAPIVNKMFECGMIP